MEVQLHVGSSRTGPVARIPKCWRLQIWMSKRLGFARCNVCQKDTVHGVREKIAPIIKKRQQLVSLDQIRFFEKCKFPLVPFHVFEAVFFLLSTPPFQGGKGAPNKYNR